MSARPPLYDEPHLKTHLLVVHVVGENTAADPHGPQELVDVVTRVARDSSKDHQYVVHVQRLFCFCFSRREKRDGMGWDGIQWN